jgi:hypothetical protein
MPRPIKGRGKLARRLTRGAKPQNSREAGARFQSGHAKRAGRPKGTPNHLTRDLKEAIVEAAIASGYNKRGKDGLKGYLKRVADHDVRTYVVLLRAVLPRHIEANITREKPYLTEEEILAELNARGLRPETMFHLRFHEEPAEDVDPYGDGDVIDLQPLKPPAEDSE